MGSQRVARSVLAAGLTAVLCTLPLGQTHAAENAPRSWEAGALRLSEAQRHSQGEGITVGVLDTGVVADHPALKGRVTTGPDYRDDGLKLGDADWGDHGTAMASDVLKIAPKAKILSVRVTSDRDKDRTGDLDVRKGAGPLSKGIFYAVDQGVDVISLSLGSRDSDFFKDEDATVAIGYAVSRGVPVLAGAGNDGAKANHPSHPGGAAGAIAVAATQQGGGRADFSTVRTYNEVAAPGVGIVSAKNTGGYEAVQGTSPATALASGVVALMLAQNPELTPAQVRTILTSTAKHPPGGWNAMVGYGQIDAAAAVRAAASPPADKTAPVPYKGRKHLATPVGTPKTIKPEIEQGPWIAGLAAGGVGLAMLIGGVVLIVGGRRRRTPAAGQPVPPQPGAMPYS